MRSTTRVRTVGLTSLVIGGLLICVSTIFVVQEFVAATNTRENPSELSPGTTDRGTPFEVPARVQADFFFTREAFLILHGWVLWIGASVWRGGLSRSRRLALPMLGYSVALVVLGHIVAAWLAQRGISVGLGY